MDIHVVDDETIVRTLIAEMVRGLDYQSMEFSSPEHYLEYMNSIDYTPPKMAILSDVMMPNMSGYELMNAVRKRYPRQRFIICTGTPEQATLENFACFYLVKPLRLEDLKKILQAIYLCNRNGPHPDTYKCASIDDRCQFGIGEWKCPRGGC